MGIEKNKEVKLKYTYDFGRDGGATSTIDLTPDVNALEAGFVVRGISVHVDTTLTSGGTPTITFGNEDDTDGYLEDVVSALGLTAGGTIREGEVAGDLIWDDTNDHALEYVIPDAGAAVPSMTIGANALTAGKLVVYIHGYMPGSVPA